MTDSTADDFPISILEQDVWLQWGWQFEYPPPRLWIQGSEKARARLPELPHRSLAVVGTREPQYRCLAITREWILPLGRAPVPFVIISGFARGIDATAHWAALEAGLPTIAVVGGGLNICYPREHQDLRMRILEADGLLLSESPPDEVPKPHSFLQRNRLIAGLAEATWVVQASIPSGALSTAGWARSLGRDLYATPCCPGDESFAGNQRLIDLEHAYPVWGPHSFGTTWMELSGALAAKTGRSDFPRGEVTPARRLSAEIRKRAKEDRGASLQQLLDWAIGQGWSPEKFFGALHEVDKKIGLSTLGGAVRPIQGELSLGGQRLPRPEKPPGGEPSGEKSLKPQNEPKSPELFKGRTVPEEPIGDVPQHALDNPRKFRLH